MIPSKTSIIESLNQFITKHSIDLIQYNCKSDYWWQGRTAILTKSYINISGGVIEQETLVCILFKMQFIRFDNVIHAGQFFVYDIETGVGIGGVDYNHLILLTEKRKIQNLQSLLSGLTH